MPLLILSPIMALAVVKGFWPDLGFYQAVPFPGTAFVVMGLVAVVASLMKQTEWLYWLALLGSHYWAAQTGLQRPLVEADVEALYQFLPLVMTAFMLLLTVVPLPALPSVSGVGLLLACLLIPGGLTFMPLADWLTAMAVPELFLSRPWEGVFLSWGHVWWMASALFLWLALVSFRGSQPRAWGQFNAWLALVLFYTLMDRANASGWMTLAGSLGLLITLAFHMVQLAYVDELTGLPQRRALQNRLSRLGRDASVTMLDVDHFKQFNDTWGHDVGDQVLRLLGGILGRQRGVQAFRYGGEEFTLVFSHGRKNDLKRKLEDIRVAVEEYPLTLRDDQRPDESKTGKQQRGAGGGKQTVNITISLGCAIRQPGEDPDALLKRADEALYKAKDAGRNCVRIV